MNRAIVIYAAVAVLLITGPSLQGQQPAAAPAPAPPLAAHQGWVTSLDFFEGQLVTGGGQSLLYRPGSVNLFRVETGEPIATFAGPTANVWAVDLSPDGKNLIAACYDGKVLVWDVSNQQLRGTLEKHKGWVRSCAFTPDGSTFATAGEDGQVVFWSTENLQEVKTIKPHESAIYQVAFSSDGNTVGTASVDKTARLWNWKDGAGMEIAKLEGHEDAVWSIAFASNGTIATAGADRKIRLWDAAGKPTTVLEGHKDWISRVAFSPDATLLASCDLGRVAKLWNLADHTVAAELGGFTGSVWCIAFSSDGKWLAAGSHKDGARVWNVAERKELYPAPPPAAEGEAKKEGQ